MKGLLTIGIIAITLAVLTGCGSHDDTSSIAPAGNTEVIEDRITDTESNSCILKGDEADMYQVYPSDDLQFGLYTTSIEIDHKIWVSLKTITEYDENGEKINRSWIETNSEETDGYDVSWLILDENIAEMKISVAGLVTISLNNTEIASEHLTYVMDSLFD